MPRPTILAGLFPAALSLALLMPVTPAAATTVVQMGLRQMTQSSNAVVHGTVVEARSRWNGDATMIVTDVRIRVSESLKGEGASEVTVTQPGGAVDGVRTEVPGAAPFGIGDEVVLFLAPGPERTICINGLFQGRLQVTVDPKTGKKMVHGLPLDARATTIPSSAGGVALDSPPPASSPEPLDHFLGNLRRMVKDLEQMEVK